MQEQLELSLHGQRRASQRGRRRSDLDLVLEFGTPVKDGVVLRQKDVDRALGNLKRLVQRMEHLVGTYVVVRGGTVVTVYDATKTQRRRLREAVA
jgi:hypothetical protein